MPQTTIALAADVLTLLSACVGVVYGLIRFVKKKALFPKLATWALGCFALGKLSTVVTLLTAGSAPEGFHVAYLGYFGCFLFFLSADFGYMDTIADDRNPAWRKYRLLAFIAPAVMALPIFALFFAPVETEELLCGVICLLPGVPATYFKLKHILIPDVEGGILLSIRRYNVCSLLICLFIAMEFVFEMHGVKLAEAGANLFISAGMAALLPVLEKGVAQWTA